MSKVTTTIELPRIEGESAKAHQARIDYVTMGAARSIDKLRQNYGKTTAYTRQLEVWSSQYGWAESAKQYDSEVSYLTVQEAQEQHRADLAAHREKAMTSAKNLMALAGGLTRIMGDALTQPRKVEGKDGKVYTLHKVQVDANTLTTISRALQTALDLEAHALGIDQIEETQD
jgi:hypothetical protein